MRFAGLLGSLKSGIGSGLYLAVFVFSAFSIALVTRAQELSPPPGVAVHDLTAHPGFFNEPAIAIDPHAPSNIVAAFQVPATAAYSRDAGKTWTVVRETAPRDYRLSGDVSLAFDNRHRAFLCYIAFDKLGTENYWAHNATRNGIFVRRSPDGGKIWDKNDVAVIAHPTRPGIPFEDKPYIFADAGTDAYAGNLYVGWTQFTLTKSVILFSRSVDGGRTWSTPIEISSHEGLPRDDNGAVEGFTAAVGPDGAIYAAWADGNRIAFTSSHDGGRTFLPSREILRVAPLYFKVADVSRANGFPQLAINPRTRHLFVSWSDYRNGDTDIFVSTSADHGAKWSRPVRANTDPIHNGCDQFFQWLSVDPLTGDAYLIFYDRRRDLENREIRAVLARSADGGRTFQNFDWTARAFVAHDDFIGDYTGIAAYGGRVYGVWAEEAAPVSAASGSGAQARSKGAIQPAEGGEARRHTLVRVGVADFSAASAH